MALNTSMQKGSTKEELQHCFCSAVVRCGGFVVFPSLNRRNRPLRCSYGKGASTLRKNFTLVDYGLLMTSEDDLNS